MRNLKEKIKGITLISLVITIVILIILAGIVINLSIGKNGIFVRSKQAKEQYAETLAREKLELILLDLASQKHTNTDYNDENEYIDNYLINKGMIVTGDVVLVDGWKFSIDRSIPKIGESLGQGEESKNIALTANVENAQDFTKATIKAEIEYEGKIAEVKINGEQEEIPEKQDGKYIIEKEVETNGNYTIYVKDENNEYKIAKAEVTEISEDLQIRTAEELVWFRDRVNKGATYEGKTITVVNNLDLGKVCYKVDGTVENDKSWEPIGNYQEEGEESTHIFKGTFNGNYHKINNLYINSDKNYQGLFGYVQNGTITGVVIEGIKDKESTEENAKITSIKGNQYVGAITGQIDNTTIQNCGNNANITAYNNNVGGIVGYSGNNSKIIGAYNRGDIIGEKNYVGGIVGILSNSNNCNAVKYSYNIGNITGVTGVGGVAGTASNYGKIYNSYNTGAVKGTAVIGGITSKLRAYALVTFSYNLGIIENTGTGEKRTGGIVGQNVAYEGSKSGSLISYSYNIKNVSSNGKYTGGITGENGQYCKIKSCYISSDVIVKKGSTKATANVGSSSNYLGKLIGYAYANNSTYISNTGILSQENMPSVYEVVNADEENGLNSGDSEYWSKTAYSNDELQTPKLKWESNVK